MKSPPLGIGFLSSPSSSGTSIRCSGKDVWMSSGHYPDIVQCIVRTLSRHCPDIVQWTLSRHCPDIVQTLSSGNCPLLLQVEIMSEWKKRMEQTFTNKSKLWREKKMAVDSVFDFYLPGDRSSTIASTCSTKLIRTRSTGRCSSTSGLWRPWRTTTGPVSSSTMWTSYQRTTAMSTGPRHKSQLR